MLILKNTLFSLFILCTSASLFGQQKVASIDGNALLNWMPETKAAEAEFNKKSEQRVAYYANQISDYQRRDSIFKSDSAKWEPIIKDLRKKELLQLSERIKTMADNWDADNQYQNNKLMEPIRARAIMAIEAVVKENGYTKWIDKSEIAKYPGARDIMALVKKKLESTPNLSTEIKFENPNFYLGEIEEKAVTHIFRFSNTGEVPLTITTVKAESSLVKAQWPKTAIKPGGQGEIAVTYNGAGQSGEFTEYLTVTSNATESPLYLQLRGRVGSYLKARLTQNFELIMLAFPKNFETLKDGISNKASSSYFSKASVYDSRRTEVIKAKNDSNAVLSLIGSYDSKVKGLAKYQELLKTISSIKLNGTALKVYKTEEKSYLTSTKWRLDNSKNTVKKEYQAFTIELTFIFMDEKNAGITISFGAE